MVKIGVAVGSGGETDGAGASDGSMVDEGIEV